MMSLREMAKAVASRMGIKESDIACNALGDGKGALPYEYIFKTDADYVSLYCNEHHFAVERPATDSFRVCDTVADVVRAMKDFTAVKEVA